MNNDNASSGSGSAATSAPKREQSPPPDAPAQKLTEAEYLAQQAHNAQLAMSKAWQEIKARLGQGANPVAWAKEYPWITIGAAAVAGFTAAAALVPTKEDQALKKLSAIERALNPPPPRHEAENGDSHKDGRGMVGTILHELLGILRPALVGLMTAGMAQNPMAAEAQ